MKINIGIKTRNINPELLKKALIESGIIVQGSAKLNCPVKTGRLRGSISYSLVGKPGNVEAPANIQDAVSEPNNKMIVKIGTNVEYASNVEYMKGGIYSFLRRSLFQNVGNIKSLFIQSLNRR